MLRAAKFNESTRVKLAIAEASRARLGMILFLVSEAFLFGALFWTYYYLRAENMAWPPADVNLTLVPASINTFILVFSSVILWLAGRAVRRGNKQRSLILLTTTILFGASFLGITLFKWTHESFRPWTSAYGSIFYTLTGFHALHVLGGLLLLAAMLIRTARNLISTTNFQVLETGSLYWHYVDLVWIIVFITLFLVR